MSNSEPTAVAPTYPRNLLAVRRVSAASVVGTALESFDFYVFAYFAAFFAGPLFFEPLGAFGGALASFMTLALGFLVRPIGAVIFGHLGDRHGRRVVLLWTVGIMGVATGLIGLLPVQADGGWFGAAALVVLRIAQGLSLGGEWGGSILLATEHAPSRQRAWWAALPQLGSPIGSILSGTLFLALTSLLSTAQIAQWGWRVPFVMALPLLAVSLYLRRSIDETPVFRALAASGGPRKLPLAALVRRQPGAVAIAVGAALLGIGSYSLMNTYTLNYGVAELGFSERDLLLATTIGGLLQLVTIPAFGALARRIGSARVVWWGALGTALAAFPLYALLTQATFGVLLAIMLVGGILPTACWAALGGLMNDLFAPEVRYSALSLSYAIAAVATGFIPAITLSLGQATSFAWWHPAVVLASLAAITLAAAWAAERYPSERAIAALSHEQRQPAST